MTPIVLLITAMLKRRSLQGWWLISAIAAWCGPSAAWAQAAAAAPPNLRPSPLNQVLQFIHTIAQAIGQAIIGAIQRILPQANIPADLVDPVGFLTVLTIFVLLAGVARRIAWIIVAVGWALIGVRIALAIAGR